MGKGFFGGIIGFILGIFGCNLFAMLKRKRDEQIDYTIHDADDNEMIRVTKD